MEEVIKKIKKFNEDRDWDQFDKEEVCNELADVMNYCILLADKLDVDIKTIILDKLKLSEIKYPVEKAKGISTKYDKL